MPSSIDDAIAGLIAYLFLVVTLLLCAFVCYWKEQRYIQQQETAKQKPVDDEFLANVNKLLRAGIDNTDDPDIYGA